MASWSLESAPTWAKDAVATDKGWVDPKNGEILVACKRLSNAVSYTETFGKGVAHTIKKKARGGARKGAGRKTNAERARVAAEQAKLSSDDGSTVVVKKVAPKPRKKASKRTKGSESK